MTCAYADPPYLGCAKRLYNDAAFDDLARHEQLIADLVRWWPDGWAMSLSTPSLQKILPLCPDDVRVAAWVKPFAVFKPNVNPAYAWEPVIWRGGRQKRKRVEPTVRDWVSANITLQKGLPGAKPPSFCWWLFDLLGLQDGDEFVDVFPGTGIVGDTWEQFKRQGVLAASSREGHAP